MYSHDIYIVFSHQCWICGQDKSQLEVLWWGLVHITRSALCLASEICQRGRDGAAQVSHVTLREIVTADVKEHVRGCHVTDTVNGTLLQEELRHRQLTVDTGVKFNAAAYVFIDLIIVEESQEEEKETLCMIHFVSISYIDPVLIPLGH